MRRHSRRGRSLREAAAGTYRSCLTIAPRERGAPRGTAPLRQLAAQVGWAARLNGLPGNWRRAGRRGAFIATIMRLPWSCRAADLSGLSAGHGQTMNEQLGKHA